MKDKNLRKYLGISEEDYPEVANDSLMQKLLILADRFVHLNYFRDCPCCHGQKYLVGDEAVKFSIWCDQGFGYPGYVIEYYTTPESYEIHKKQIDKWAADIKKQKKQNERTK